MDNKKRIGTCVTCGRTNIEVTDDHVPPQNIFPKPRPDNMIEVPGCDYCNNGSSILDDRFGIYLNMASVASSATAAKVFKNHTIKRIKSNKKLLRHIKSGLESNYITTEKGITHHNGDRLLWDSKCYDATIERTIRGFYWRHYNEILGDKASVKVAMFRTIPPELSAGFGLCSHNEIGKKGDLVYKYLRDPDNPLNSMWLLVFNRRVIAFGTTKPHNLFEKYLYRFRLQFRIFAFTLKKSIKSRLKSFRKSRVASVTGRDNRN